MIQFNATYILEHSLFYVSGVKKKFRHYFNILITYFLNFNSEIIYKYKTEGFIELSQSYILRLVLQLVLFG